MEDYRHQPREGRGGDGTVPPEQRKSHGANAPDLRGQERDEGKSGEEHEEQDGARECHDGRIITNRGKMTETLNSSTGEHMSERIQRVMVITAHPDDSEFGAGGTIAKLTREGKIVTYCILTNGNKGSSDRTMTPERLVRMQ